MVEDKEREKWAAIEADYLSGQYSVQELSRRHDMSASKIYKKASKDGWKKKQAKIRQKADEIVITRHARARAREIETMCSAAARLSRVLDTTLSNIEEHPELGFDDPRGISDLAKAIKANTDALMLLHGIQTPAQVEAQRIARARLKLEERKARREEQREAEDSRDAEVLLTITERTKTEVPDGVQEREETDPS